MCDHCDNPPLSRRNLLKLSALSVPALLTACAETTPVRQDLPSPDIFNFADLPEGSPPIHINPKTIPIPPTAPPERTDLGDIHPRSSWTSSPLTLKNGIKFETDPKNNVRPNPRDLLVIHHSGDGKPFLPASRADVIRHLEIVRQAHLQRGMIDIAYHFGVDPFGQAWQLRSLMYEGQHCRPGKNGQSFNSHSIGVCLLGDFNLQALPTAQRDRLFALVKLLRAKYALPMTAVKMHGELVDTDCPGKSLRAALTTARTQKSL